MENTKQNAVGKRNILSKCPIPSVKYQPLCRFTLIELLVVIAIIGILASLLLPVLGKAKAMGKTIKCASNLKQCGMTMLMYVSDSDGYFPCYRENPTSNDNNEDGYYLCVIARYAKIPHDKSVGSILQCPEDIPHSRPGYELQARTLFTNYTGVREYEHTYFLYTSYGGSVALFKDSKVNGVLPQVKTSHMKKPVETFMLTDASNHTLRQWNQYFYIRHNRGVNMAFADGHVTDFRKFIMPIPTGTACGENGSVYKTVMTHVLTEFPWSKTW